MSLTKEHVVAEIRGCVVAIVGDEWAETMDISPDRKLSDGLDLDSIEIAKVVATMMTRYPDVEFAAWFSGMDMARITALTLGDLAEFIVRSRNGRVLQ
ncbi:hypothetical protein [Tahibacter amnicola]|uniref:Acyl carrier protein n=1 Tax=Tahibacter amnicola TaxID=2976241 RepID=A0ABY6BKU9_9GAMM|nr:hypothetical protein [Tahibacter amnicola]UXI69010.1 hypothetical protein N4264_04975 [Tahibacter amnicola]